MGYFNSEESRQRHREANLRGQETQARNRRERYDKNPKYCQWCGNMMPYEKRMNKYCNQSCSASYNNRNRVGPSYCIHCNGLLKKNAKMYCSNECQGEHTRQENIREWLETGNDYRGKKEYILEEQGGKCNHCGITEWNGKPITLDLEHIDGNSENNRRENLECICPNCHSQTPTYKAKNVGNGRHSRRKRYKEGKSY